MNVRNVYAWEMLEVNLPTKLIIKVRSYSELIYRLSLHTGLKLKPLVFNIYDLDVQSYYIYGSQESNHIYIFYTLSNDVDVLTINRYFIYDPIAIEFPPDIYTPMDTIGDIIDYYKIPISNSDKNMDRSIQLDFDRQLFKTNNIMIYIQYYENLDLKDLLGIYYTLLLLHNDISLLKRVKDLQYSKLRRILPIEVIHTNLKGFI